MYSQLIYYYKNKNKKLQYQKEYNNINKEKIKNYYINYYQKNKNKINEKRNQKRKIIRKEIRNLKNFNYIKQKTILYFN